MYRIGRSHRNRDASFGGGVGGILPLHYDHSNPHHSSWWETVSGGQFDWGGRLPKGNGGAQRFAQNGWKSFAECKGTSELDCETDRSSINFMRTLEVRTDPIFKIFGLTNVNNPTI